MPDLVLLRHGQSLFNREGRFTGWIDADLTAQGKKEAWQAGRVLLAAGYRFDTAYTSVLKRAIRTLWIVLDEMDLMWIPVHKSWRLNERNYGALQGRLKSEVEEIYGPEQVHRWRRGFRDLPPALEGGDIHNPDPDPRYRDLGEGRIFRGESLEDTQGRLIPLWDKEISPELKKGKRMLISSHGNTIRALIMHLERLSDQDIEQVEIPTGQPLVYRLDQDLHPVDHFYLLKERKVDLFSRTNERIGT